MDVCNEGGRLPLAEKVRWYVLGVCGGNVAEADAIIGLLVGDASVREASASCNVPRSTIDRKVRAIREQLQTLVSRSDHEQSEDAGDDDGWGSVRRADGDD